MDFRDVIAARRDGKTHPQADFEALARGAASGEIPDYQLAAWLMAAYLHPLTLEDTAGLTVAMARSGERVDLTGIPKPWVDKHSTGGVGDKTTIVLLPLLASCGLHVIKMSGRGLGITGGTVDKLGSIPGFRLDLSPAEMKEQAAKIGIALTGQTPDLAPADKALYALRDATATVDSLPLIVSSILSKKLAGGAEIVVIDVKCGSGAFMKTQDEAEELAKWLESVGAKAGLRVRCAITDMDQPLGICVGNALEVREAILILRRDGGSERFKNVVLDLAGITLATAGASASEEEGRSIAAEALESGRALEKAEEWFRAQGVTMSTEQILAALPRAPLVKDIVYEGQPGVCERVDAGIVGQAVVDLGGGRKTKSDAIDPAVGVEVQIEVGDRLQPGQPMFKVHARTDNDLQLATSSLRAAVEARTAS